MKLPDDYNDFLLNTPARGFQPDRLLVDYYYNNKLVNGNFEFVFTTNQEVLDIVTSIKYNASGHDDISISLVNLALPVLLPYLTHLVNT